MILAEALLTLTVLLGHGALWVGLNNRLHAAPLKRSHLKPISALSHFGTLAVPLVFAWWLFRERQPLGAWHSVIERSPTALYYVLLCIGVTIVHVPRWLYVRFVILRAAWRQGRRLKLVDVAERLNGWPTHGIHFALARHVPFNQAMRIEFSEKQVSLPNLPSALEGLRILHLSDLHLSGRVLPSFFKLLVGEVNALAPDLVLLTGDVCDTVKCLPWLDEILSPISARYGKYFILGNHDDRLKDIAELRTAITATGFVDLGGRHERLELRGVTILLAGNELPWFGPVPQQLPNDADLRLLLSHSSDQIRWARRNRFDLMLSGHTHGGQIRFPIIGPVVCPSWYGVRYASGLFHETPTITHVSRGASGLFPLRWNCLPEVTLLVLSALR